MSEERQKRLCDAIIHCEDCRTSEKARLSIRMPEICPYGWTKDHLPKIITVPEGQLDKCRKCENYKNCSCITFCKSCGGREVPRFAGECPKHKT